MSVDSSNNSEEKWLKTPRRTKGKFNGTVNIRTVWQTYCKNTKPSERLSLKQFMTFMKEFNGQILNELYNGERINLSHKCGYLQIVKRKMSFKSASHLRIDWHTSKQLKKRVYHLNEHRNNYTYRFKWTRGGIHYIAAYTYMPLLKYRRRLANILINQPEIDYPALYE